MGFPKIRGTILGVPTIRTIVFLGLYWGPLFGNVPLWAMGSGLSTNLWPEGPVREEYGMECAL